METIPFSYAYAYAYVTPGLHCLCLRLCLSQENFPKKREWFLEWYLLYFPFKKPFENHSW